MNHTYKIYFIRFMNHTYKSNQIINDKYTKHLVKTSI